jgi:BirA family biotin operon repressor/biotin-[acetyl-CoA-carboxylase] ligase
MISVERIRAWCSTDARAVTITVVPETASTNTDLLQGIAVLEGPTLLLAERQTQGRGRSGRRWLSSPEGSLTFSLAWPFGGALHQLTGLSLVAGVAVGEALAAYGVRTAMKWPNDILKEGKKLGGILIETERVSEGTWAVIGIGLNLALPHRLEAAIGQAAAEVRWLAGIDRNQLIAVLLNALCTAMRLFEQQGFAAFRDRWNQGHAHRGQRVVITREAQTMLEGVAIGVDELGCLIIDTDAGKMRVHSGEVSLRSMEGSTCNC